MSEATIAAGFAGAFIALAVSKGARRAALLARAGIDPALLEDADNRIALAKFGILMREAKAQTGDAALALHFGEAFAIDELSIVGLIGRASRTMADAFAQLNRYARLAIDVDGVSPGPRLVAQREGGLLWLVDTRANPNDFPELTESGFARMASASSRLVEGGGRFLKAVEVTHPEPAYRGEYDRIFGVPVAFASARNAVAIDETVMALKLSQSNGYVFGVLSEKADALLKSLESARTVRGRVESLLIPILHTGNATVDTVAARMGVSRQTLFRRLKSESVTFEKVLDELRHRMALDYLRARKVSVNEAAYLVGFSEPSAFSRAFRRWTGTSPRAMRTGLR
jgi:AraC-like DNA-binding protein